MFHGTLESKSRKCVMEVSTGKNCSNNPKETLPKYGGRWITKIWGVKKEMN